MFLIEDISSTMIKISWYDPGGAFGNMYPYGANFDWYLDNVYRGSTQVRAGNSITEPITFLGLSPGTMYTITARAYAYDMYGEPGYDLGSVSTTVTTLSRPAYFSWTVPKVKGEQFYVGADEWKQLMLNVITVVSYATGVTPTLYYGNPIAGEVLMAARYNELRAAIQTVPGYGYYIPQVSRGQTVTASHMNVLVSELNAIP